MPQATISQAGSNEALRVDDLKNLTRNFCCRGGELLPFGYIH